MQKSLIVSEKVHNELVKLKLSERAKNISELLERLIIEHRKQNLHKARKMFREALNKKGITFDEFLKRANKIREEMYEQSIN